jgi:methionyl-tRNA formyltransferase
MTPLATVFMGTAPLAATILRALCADPNINLRAVVTQPDKPKGRDLKLQSSMVKEAALQAGLPVLQPNRARDESFIGQLRSLNLHLIVVAAYGQILPPAILELPTLGCLNVHTSLLPKYRGAAPIQWAILDGLSETGVTIMKMDAGLDTGPMIATETLNILPDDTGATLHDRLAGLGAKLLVETLPAYAEGKLQPRPQPAEGVSYARKITKEDGLIDWSSSATSIANRVRALNPWPTAYTSFPAGGTPQMIKIWKAAVEKPISGEPGTVVDASRNGIVVACSHDALRILELQREGRRRVSAGDFLAGCPLPPGTVLGSGRLKA